MNIQKVHERERSRGPSVKDPLWYSSLFVRRFFFLSRFSLDMDFNMHDSKRTHNAVFRSSAVNIPAREEKKIVYQIIIRIITIFSLSRYIWISLFKTHSSHIYLILVRVQLCVCILLLVFSVIVSWLRRISGDSISISHSIFIIWCCMIVYPPKYWWECSIVTINFVLNVEENVKNFIQW